MVLSSASALSKAADLLAADLEAGQARPWRASARPKQLPPGGEWNIWLVMAGRGWGKNYVGSNWLAEQAAAHAGSEWAILCPTFRDVRKTAIEGTTGILAALSDAEVASYHRNELRVTLTNGARIYGYSADQPERLRGANLSGAWADELGSFRYEQTWYEGLVPALRIGAHPRIIVTTTPRPTHLMRDLLGRDDGTVHVTRGSTWENTANLSGTALTELRRRYEGTRLGRQELEGELLAAIEGALWNREDIDTARVRPDGIPDLTRIVVAVDPAITSKASSDETGIVVAGEDGTGHAYVLADYSMRGTPDACMRKAVSAYREHNADRVVAEANNGGDYLEQVLRTVDNTVPYRKVMATRGKAIRAEPVSALYEQHRIHHRGILPELEDELCTWTPADPISPNRLDALVWAITDLNLSSGNWASAYGTRCPECGEVHGTYYLACPQCHPDGAHPAPTPPGHPETGPEPLGNPYAPELVRCPQRHTYNGALSTHCPHCQRGRPPITSRAAARTR